jgi:hypothetical protein
VSLDFMDQIEGPERPSVLEPSPGGVSQNTLKHKDHPQQLVFDFV